MHARRLYLAVGLCAIVVYLGALWNRFALDDLVIIAQDPLVHSLSGAWRAFGEPYLRGAMYRPLTIATYTLDWPLQSFAWFHAVNLLWHAAASVLVAVLARRWLDTTGAFVAGLLFAVHPVHVEAVANIVGRDELMAACFALVAVYAGLVRGSVLMSAVALSLGLLCKENAAVVPGLIAWGWVIGLARPERRRIVAFAASWVAIALAYGFVRWLVLHSTEDPFLAPVFAGLPALEVRLTALSALTDVARLLVFPLTLRADYGPLERTAVTSLGDARLIVALLCLSLWGLLLGLAWRRGWRVEAFGLGWIAIAFSPVANLLFPTGILVAERTLYLPSAGLALAAGATVARLPARWISPVVAAVIAAAAIRTALRVPVWRSDNTAILSILQDSPRSYVGPKRMVGVYLDARQPARALEAALQAKRLFPRDLTTSVSGAIAAFAADRPAVADSLLDDLERVCRNCVEYYYRDAAMARRRGYMTAADSIEARARVLEAKKLR